MSSASKPSSPTRPTEQRPGVLPSLAPRPTFNSRAQSPPTAATQPEEIRAEEVEEVIPANTVLADPKTTSLGGSGRGGSGGASPPGATVSPPPSRPPPLPTQLELVLSCDIDLGRLRARDDLVAAMGLRKLARERLTDCVSRFLRVANPNARIVNLVGDMGTANAQSAPGVASGAGYFNLEKLEFPISELQLEDAKAVFDAYVEEAAAAITARYRELENIKKLEFEGQLGGIPQIHVRMFVVIKVVLLPAGVRPPPLPEPPEELPPPQNPLGPEDVEVVIEEDAPPKAAASSAGRRPAIRPSSVRIRGYRAPSPRSQRAPRR